LSEPWITDRWISSRWNFERDVLDQLHLPQKVEIYDITLRDGEQQPGIVFDKESKLKIAKALAELGIHGIEAGMPAISPEDFETVREIARLGLFSKVKAFCRARKDDVDNALKCDVSGVVIEVPCSDIYIKMGIQKTRQWVTDAAVESISYAKDHGLYVTFFPYDTTRADPNFLKELVTTVRSQTTMDSLVIVDTLGVASPQAFASLIKSVKNWFDMPIEVHCHNHLGLATANTLAGITAGAEVAHTTVNGIGESSGNAAMEEVVIGLLVLHGIDLNLRYENLCKVSDLVQELSGVRVMPGKPIVGKTTFIYEAGISVMYLRRLGARNYLKGIYPFLPSLVGNTYGYVIGKKSGIHNIEWSLERMGLEYTEDETSKILEIVKKKATESKRLLTEEEFKKIVKDVL